MLPMLPNQMCKFALNFAKSLNSSCTILRAKQLRNKLVSFDVNVKLFDNEIYNIQSQIFRLKHYKFKQMLKVSASLIRHF